MTKSINQKERFIPNRFQDFLEGKEGQILEAAFYCISERGIAASSTHAIAERAGLNQGSIHYYFKSKDELLERLMEVMFHTFNTNIKTVARGNLSGPAKLERIIESGFTLISQRRDEFIVMVAFWAHAVSVGGEMLRIYERHFREFRTAVVKVLEEDETMMRFDPEVRSNVAMLVVGGVQGLGLQLALDPQAFDVERVEQFMRSLLRYALKEGGVGNSELKNSKRAEP